MRHHDFDGLTTKRVAAMLSITTHSVARHMQEMQKVAPQLFPILTRQQADIHHLFVNVGLRQKTIAELLNISKSCVGVLVHRIRAKGMYIPRRQYQDDVPYMPRAHDHIIRQKF
jgi:DNA-binding CsgD family transcriptional regulator